MHWVNYLIIVSKLGEILISHGATSKQTPCAGNERHVYCHISEIMKPTCQGNPLIYFNTATDSFNPSFTHHVTTFLYSTFGVFQTFFANEKQGYK